VEPQEAAPGEYSTRGRRGVRNRAGETRAVAGAPDGLPGGKEAGGRWDRGCGGERGRAFVLRMRWGKRVIATSTLFGAASNHCSCAAPSGS
jgi:hypothetical protein